MSVASWKHYFNGKHFESGDIPDGTKPAIKIISTAPCDPEDTGGEQKMLITFEPGAELRKAWDAEQPKPKKKNTWICAKTIGYQLEAMFGGNPAGWNGKVVNVYVADVKGEPAVRIYGSPQIQKSVTIRVRDFGGKRTWTMVPTGGAA